MIVSSWRAGIVGWALAVLVCSVLGGRANAQMADALVAIVGGNTPSAATLVVLLSDVEFEVILERDAAGLPLDAEYAPGELERARDRLIELALLVREATRLRIDVVDARRRDACFARFAAVHGGSAAMDRLLVRFGVSPEEYERRALWSCIARDLALRSAESGAVVSDEDVDQAMAERAPLPPEADVSRERERVRVELLEARIEAERTRLAERLSARTIVARRRLGTRPS